jgi:hypothetical protein
VAQVWPVETFPSRTSSTCVMDKEDGGVLCSSTVCRVGLNKGGNERDSRHG